MRAWRVIYRKEIADTLRDRRTLATMLIVPMVAYPLTLLLTTETIAVHQRESELREVHIFASPDLPASALAALNAAKGVRAATSTLAAGELLDPAARSALASGQVDAVVSVRREDRAAIEGDGTGKITIHFDGTRNIADTAVRRTESALSAWIESARDARMRAHDLPPTAAVPAKIARRSISTKRDVGKQIAALALPALILVFIALSSFYPAVDLTAGEKERKTLATLLCAPVHPFEIVLGKYFAVVTVGTIAGLLNVIVLSLTLLRVAAGDDSAGGLGAAFTIPLLPILGLLPLVTLISLPVGAMMLLVALLARSFRDASYLLTPILLVAVAPASLATLPGIELSPMLAALPLANAALFMKALLLHKGSFELGAMVVISSLAFTLLLLFSCARVFLDERVLFSESGRRVELSALFLEPPLPSVATGLVFAGVLFVFGYYGGFLTARWPPVWSVAFTQASAHAVPAIALALWMRRRVRPSVMLRIAPPSARAILAGLLVGLGAWLAVSLPVAWLTDLFLPGQGEAARALEKALGLENLSFGRAFVFFALLPAAAEELAFRGALLSLLERAQARPWTAIVFQAVLFGAMHGSIFRLVPATLLGILLGLLAQRSGSLLPGILAHTLTNGILIAVERLFPASIGEALEKPTPLALAGVAVLGLGLWSMRGVAPLTRTISDT